MADIKELFGRDLEVSQNDGDFSPIPDGRYTLKIDACDGNRQTKSGKLAIGFKFKVVGPTHAGRIIFIDLYVGGVSEKCANVSFSKLSRISMAAFGRAVRNTDELVGGILDADVVTNAQPGYKPRNDIAKYYKSTDQAQPEQAAASDDDTMPW